MLLLLSACAGAPPTPPPAEPRVWAATGEPRGVIVALHSFGDHAAAFNLAAPALAEAGYSVYAFDQAGFGGRNLDDHWAGEARLVDDAAALTRRLADRYPDRPLYLLGESLGGAVAMLVAARHPDLPLDGLILAAPAVREGIRLRYGWNVLIAAAATVAPGYRLKVARPPDDPKLAPGAARRLAEDPLVMRRVRLDAYRGLILLADDASDAAPALSLPTLVLYGGQDTSVPAVGIRRLNAHLGDHGAYRFFTNGPHLLLQGRHWPQVVDAILAWLPATTELPE
ncbi:alpha/beta fold hydrolase [Alloalcanivorax sp. C16-2]|uniref:alpha/beta fold hydrolase n=1 Tax=Alloalcanivorax TaxID=3020832 RepID=UPI0019318D12|nr:alpha/beta fold hydrolase [Alloalcanivorax marinus]MBL7250430.1 alpha/beta fold hydrolase [Alloalcanivorax marinus]